MIVLYTKNSFNLNFSFYTRSFIRSKPFEIFDSNLFRFEILKDKKQYDLFFDFHHIIADANAMKLFIDSVAALTPKAEIEGDMGENKVGLQARLMSQALRKLTATINKTKTTCIFINQLREKIGVMFGNPETTTGGNALKFYASVRLDIRKSSPIKDGDNVIGNEVKVKVVKNKVAPPFRRAEFEIMYGEGISRVGEVVDLGVSFNLLEKSGSWYSYNGTKLGQGKEATKGVLRDNPELCEEITAKIYEAMNGKKE